MSSKELTAQTVRAIAWDQVFGYLDRCIFYPALAFLAFRYGYLSCFIVVTPWYFLFSLIIVGIHYRSMYERNQDVFGMHFLQEISQKTKPPKFGRNIFLYPYHQLRLSITAVRCKQFRVAGHIIQRMCSRFQMKTQSWLLNNRWTLYTIGTLHVFDPGSVFMFTQKCRNEKELVSACIKKLSLLVTWHIAYWSLIFWAAAKGYSWIVQP